MSVLSLQRATCRLCGGGDLEVVFEPPPTPLGDDYVSIERLKEVQEPVPLDLCLCRGCGHVQLSEVVDANVLYGQYMYVSSISLGLREHFERYADDVLRRLHPPTGSLVIDIGSNDGTLLRCFQRQGMRVVGVEPAREIARAATESGIETLPGFFTRELARQVRERYGPAAIVTANNVFANVDDVAEMIVGVHDLLAPDGVFVFETSYLVDVIQKVLPETIFHEHLSYFSAKPLDAFFHRYGMQLMDGIRVPTKGGSLRGIVQLAGGPRTVSPAVTELMDLETALGLDRPEAYRAFATAIDTVKHQLLKRLHGFKARGDVVAGYGASVGVTTLIYLFDVGNLLSFLVDDNPVKQNRFSPGHHIPVLSSQALYERKPGSVLVLPWAYTDPIVNRHEAYLKQGGQFIVPLPVVRVIGRGKALPHELGLRSP